MLCFSEIAIELLLLDVVDQLNGFACSWKRQVGSSSSCNNLARITRLTMGDAENNAAAASGMANDRVSGSVAKAEVGRQHKQQ